MGMYSRQHRLSIRDPGEVYWAASDIGWVVGHSYIVYGPLLHGNTTVLYEGKPVGTPDAGAFWRVASEHRVACLMRKIADREEYRVPATIEDPTVLDEIKTGLQSIGYAG